MKSKKFSYKETSYQFKFGLFKGHGWCWAIRFFPFKYFIYYSEYTDYNEQKCDIEKTICFHKLARNHIDKRNVKREEKKLTKRVINSDMAQLSAMIGE